MKKTLILVIVFATSLCCHAQLQVKSDGIVSIGDAGNYNYPFFINGNNYNYSCRIQGGKSQLYIYNNGVTYSGKNGINIMNVPGNVETHGVNVVNYGTGSSSGWLFGVKSLGGNSTTLSCGVMGGLSGQYITTGAGIYGSSTVITGILGTQYTGKYAGFFDGDVRVTGTIYGILLTPSKTSSELKDEQPVSSYIVSSSSDAFGEGVSDKLKQVNLLRLDLQTENANSKETSNVFVESDLYRSLTYRLENGEELTDEEMEQLEIEMENMEKQLYGRESPQTRMASTRYGLDADQLRSVYPELVFYDQNGNVSINYIEMVPLLVQSINELQERIDNLEQDNVTLRAELSGDETSVKSHDGATGIENIETDILSLSQNNPNPFSERTTISLNIPASVTTAAVFFYDMSGKQIAKRIITERGQSQLSVTSVDFSEGMYLYSLIADGKVVSTRKMILTK